MSAAPDAPSPAAAPAAPASLVRNSLSMVLARGYVTLVSAALTIVAVRVLDVEDYSAYSLVIALSAIAGMLTDLGVSTLGMRQMSQHPERQEEILGTTVAAELVTSGIAALLILPVGLLLGYSSKVMVLLALVIPYMLLSGFTVGFQIGFQARRLMVLAGGYTAMQATVSGVIGFGGLALGWGPEALVIALGAGQLTAAVAAGWLTRSRLHMWPKLRGAWRTVPAFMRAALPIAMASSVLALYDRVDIVLVSKLAGEAKTALYSVPLTVQQTLLIVPHVISVAFFPSLAERIREDPQAVRDRFFVLVRVFLVISVPMGIGLAVAARPVLTFAFGDEYAKSAATMALLAPTIAIGFLVNLLWAAMIAAHREKQVAALLLGGLALNVAANAVAIPHWGVEGAAGALLLSDAVVLVALSVMLHRRMLRVPVGDLLLKPLLAGAAAAVAAVLLDPVSDFVAGTGAVVAFLAVLLPLGYVSAEEWRPLTGPVGDILGRLRRKTT